MFTRKERQDAVGNCPYCGEPPTWFNDVPLKAFCWGTEEKPHREWKKIVPPPHNPYLPGYGDESLIKENSSTEDSA